MTHEPPHKVNTVFDIPIEELIIDPRKNMRGLPNDELVLQMACSIREMGQLQNILVVWRGHAYEVVVGYTRAFAIAAHKEQIGVKTIRAMQIAPENEDAARIAENFVRQNPTTFETAKFFSELCAGRNRNPLPTKHVAAIVGKSEDYVRGLLRLYREVPANVRMAWQADRDRQFTFHKLAELVRLKQAGHEAAVNARLHEILSATPRRRAGAAALGSTLADQYLTEALKGCGLVQPPGGGIPVPDLRPLRAASNKPRVQRISRRQLSNMKAKLSSVPRERLMHCTIGGDRMFRFVLAVLGEAPRSEAWSIIENMVAGTSDREGTPREHERRYLQTPDLAHQDTNGGETDPAVGVPAHASSNADELHEEMREALVEPADGLDPTAGTRTSERRYLQTPDLLSQVQGTHAIDRVEGTLASASEEDDDLSEEEVFVFVRPPRATR